MHSARIKVTDGFVVIYVNLKECSEFTVKRILKYVIKFKGYIAVLI